MRKDSIFLTIFLALLVIFTILATDMALPAFGQISEGLGADVASVTLTLVFFMLGFALAPLLAGPVSDSFGRRVVLIAGAVFFTLGSIACTFAPAIDWLLMARVLQGAGAGICSVLSLTIVRDLFEGAEARSKLSQINAVMAIGPVIAPSLGSVILTMAGWRAIYGFLAVAGLFVLLVGVGAFKESSRPEMRRALSFKELRASYGRVLSSRTVVTNLVINALLAGNLFAYISSSPHVWMNVMGAGKGLYSLIFAIGSLGIGLGAGINGILAKKNVEPSKIVGWGLVLLTLTNVALTSATAFGVREIAGLVPMVTLMSLSFGLVAPNSAHGALAPLPEDAGAVSGLLGFGQMAMGAGVSALVALFLEKYGAVAMSGGMLVCSLLALFVFVTFSGASGAKVLVVQGQKRAS